MDQLKEIKERVLIAKKSALLQDAWLNIHAIDDCERLVQALEKCISQRDVFLESYISSRHPPSEFKKNYESLKDLEDRDLNKILTGLVGKY